MLERARNKVPKKPRLGGSLRTGISWRKGAGHEGRECGDATEFEPNERTEGGRAGIAGRNKDPTAYGQSVDMGLKIVSQELFQSAMMKRRLAAFLKLSSNVRENSAL